MADDNLFTMLSAYRPGSNATPFENYCTSAIAYFLQRGHRTLTALFATASGTPGEQLAVVEVQPLIADIGIVDLVLTFEDGRRAIVEVQVEPSSDTRGLMGIEEFARYWQEHPALVFLGLPGTPSLPNWKAISWVDIADALEGEPETLAWQFAEFIMRDVLGLGPVPLEQALSTNRLYAIGGAALRRKFGDRARYINSASRPMNGRYRYMGTTFSLDGDDMSYWLGIVNEALPLSEHYHVMLASKTAPLLQGAERPRATGDWKDWGFWTGLGRVVRPITTENYVELLDRILSGPPPEETPTPSAEPRAAV